MGNNNYGLTYKTPVKHKEFIGTALLCDDSTLSRAYAKQQLEIRGLTVFVAENGKECLKKAVRFERDNNPFDIIFIDIFLTAINSMSGLETAKKLRERRVCAPIIGMTVNLSIADRERYIKVGMTECIGKPFRPHELDNCLMSHLPYRDFD